MKTDYSLSDINQEEVFNKFKNDFLKLIEKRESQKKSFFLKIIEGVYSFL